MIKAIIFDCYGVLTTDAWIAFKKRHFRDDAGKASKASELNSQAGTGDITYSRFLDDISKLANMPTDEVKQEINQNVADDELFEYIGTLKPKYKIGMLSNAAADRLEKLFSPEQIAVFDSIILSYEVGVVKPDEIAYEMIAKKLSVNVEDCIFIDDQEKHCIGARRAGMSSILYKGFDDMKAKLEEALTAGSDN
jgi:epoxide hydrolase-like predicted phosphatase